MSLKILRVDEIKTETSDEEMEKSSTSTFSESTAPQQKQTDDQTDLLKATDDEEMPNDSLKPSPYIAGSESNYELARVVVINGYTDRGNAILGCISSTFTATTSAEKWEEEDRKESIEYVDDESEDIQPVKEFNRTLSLEGSPLIQQTETKDDTKNDPSNLENTMTINLGIGSNGIKIIDRCVVGRPAEKCSEGTLYAITNNDALSNEEVVNITSEISKISSEVGHEEVILATSNEQSEFTAPFGSEGVENQEIESSTQKLLETTLSEQKVLISVTSKEATNHYSIEFPPEKDKIANFASESVIKTTEIGQNSDQIEDEFNKLNVHCVEVEDSSKTILQQNLNDHYIHQLASTSLTANHLALKNDSFFQQSKTDETNNQITPELYDEWRFSPRTLTRIKNLKVIMQDNEEEKDGAESIIHHHPIFVKDTSKYWYKPKITREEAISILKNKPAGTFIIRDSNSFPGAFGLALKVASAPPGIPSAADGSELVRHFLIEPSNKGVRLKGCPDEPIFGTLSALVYQHSITPLALPCRLILPEYDPAKTPEHINSNQTLLERGAACNVTYLCSLETESLTGPEALKRSATHCLEMLYKNELNAVPVHFKVSSQGITLTDNTRTLFFRRHYPVASVTYAGTDPENRTFDNNKVKHLPPTYVRQAPVFGFVARKYAANMNGNVENVCHVFAELDPDQPATAVVRFITNVMMPLAKIQMFQIHEKTQ